MSAIIVCPLSRAEEIAARENIGAAVSILSPGARPPLLAPRQLCLSFSDISTPVAGHRLAGAEDMARLLDFLRDWDRQNPLLIHCWAGVSRSPAAAFIAACALTGRDETVLAGELRKKSPAATPNPHLVALADAALTRQGRMTAAILAIGRGQDCFEGDVFSLDVTGRAR